MHPLCLHREMVVGLVRLLAAGIGFKRGEGCDLARRAGWRMGAQFFQRILRPAALARRGRWRRTALGFLLATSARRQSETVAEGAAEMRGVAKTVAIGDFRDRAMRFRRIGQIGPGTLQPALA